MEKGHAYPQIGIKFSHKWWVILIQLPFLLFRLLIGAAYIFCADKLFSAVSPIDNLSAIDIFILILGCFVVVVALLHFFGLWLRVGNVFLSYVKILPWGIEYSIMPSYGIRCRWEDIDRKGKDRPLSLSFAYEVLNLRKVEPFGRSLNVPLLNKLFSRNQNSIPLKDFTGWPTGKLAEQLQRYIPEILSPDDPTTKIT